MRVLLDNPDFRRLWLGQLASSLGTWLLVVAVPLHVFDLTGSTMATGIAFAAETLPAVLLGPVAGVLVDRLDRRRLMIGVDVVRALAVLSMLAADSPERLWLIYAALLIENGAGQLFRPARLSIVPALIGPDVRPSAANAMFAVIDGLVRLIGSVAGGLLYLTVGFSGLVLTDAASYLVSAAGCYLVRHRALRSGRTDPASGLTSGPAELRAGLLHLRQSSPLRGMLLVTATFYLANGAITALLVPFARIELRIDASRFGYLLAALGCGYLLGAPVARWAIEQFSTRWAVISSVPLLAACYLVAFEPASYPLTLVAFAVSGAPAVVLLVAVQTDCQSRTPDALLGRVTSAFLT
ncbi:MAG TPA: MFS transporter, partial [Kineosporiaceae bacterium]|nr:MFS transporter [Kineosporiaceae bacterium]